MWGSLQLHLTIPSPFPNRIRHPFAFVLRDEIVPAWHVPARAVPCRAVPCRKILNLYCAVPCRARIRVCRAGPCRTKVGTVPAQQQQQHPPLHTLPLGLLFFVSKNFCVLNTFSDEIDMYLSDIFTKEEYSAGLIQFWTDKKGKYKKLSRAALEILSLPPTTVTCESSFSLLKIFVSDKRENLSATTINHSFILRSFEKIAIQTD
jgi:hypothetical protein